MNRLSVKSKLIVLLLSISLSSILAISFMSWLFSRDALMKNREEHLRSVHLAKVNEIEAYFKGLIGQAEVLGEDQTVIEAMVHLNKAYKELDANAEETGIWDEAIKSHYHKHFFPKLPKISPNEHDAIIGGVTGSQAARYLQYRYIVRKKERDDTESSIEQKHYSDSHDDFHEFFGLLCKNFGFYDVFLIDYESENIVYTHRKEVDFGTSLKDGPYSTSGLAEVVKAVKTDHRLHTVKLQDFKLYRPSYDKPAAFIVTPIYNGPHIVGIFAFQLSIDRINNVMTGNGNWEANGLGQTGQSFLVGRDKKVRSSSRFLLEALKSDEQTKTSARFDEYAKTQKPSDIENIKSFKSTVLLKEVTGDPSEMASEKDQPVLSKDYRDEWVLGYYSALNIHENEIHEDELNWYLHTEMDRSEVYEPARALQATFLFGTATVVLLVTFLAIPVSHGFTRPLDKLIAAAKGAGAEESDGEDRRASHDEFGRLADSLNKMIKKLQSQDEEIKKKDADQDDWMLNFLPKGVVRRLQNGDTHFVDEIEHVSLLFAHVAGFAKLSEKKAPAETIRLLSDLVDSFYSAAEHHGIEPVKTVGGHFLAVCGLSSRQFDHVRRTLDFAQETLLIVDKFNKKHGTDLAMQIGVNAGTIKAGIAGHERFQYDLWGEAVNVVMELHGAARPGVILVSKTVYEAGESYSFEQELDAQPIDRSRRDVWSLQPSAKSSEADETQQTPATLPATNEGTFEP